MSIDYALVNDSTRTNRYFGVARGDGSFTIGYARADEKGREAIAAWIAEQFLNGAKELRMVHSEDVPDGYEWEHDDEA